MRIRLTIWYSAILACGLCVFAIAIWILLKHALYDGLQKSLAQRSASLQSFIVHEAGEPGVHLTEELEEYCGALPQGTYFWLTDADGRRVFASNPAFDPSPKAMRGQEYAPWQVWALPHYLRSQQPIAIAGVPHQITGLISAREARSILHQLGILLMTLAPGVLLMSSLGGLMLSRRALRPVDEITQAAQTLSIRDLTGRLPVNQTGDELQRLAETWNSMLDRVEDSVERLLRFTQDASHELRTPLAIIRTTAEIAMRRSRSEEAYRRAFSQVIDESDRLTLLTEDLLLLARGDHPTKPEMLKISLSRLVADVCRDMATLSEQKTITVATELPAQPTWLYGDPTLLRRLLVVLLDNAIKYSPPSSNVTVKLREVEGSLDLRVEDEGPGIGDSDQPFIFERFYRGERARQAWSNGTGLGLSLAASIAEQHGATIEVVSNVGKGSVFIVRFPAPVTPALLMA